jgi:hypothetical protein
MLGLQEDKDHTLFLRIRSQHTFFQMFSGAKCSRNWDITSRMYQDLLDMLQEGLILQEIRTCSVCALSLGHILMRVDHPFSINCQVSSD